MNDTPRRALTKIERETLSTVEEIQIAQSKPVEVSPQRTLPPATDAPGRFMHAMEPHIGESAKDQMAAALGILLGELGRLERKVAVLEERPELKYVGVWRDGHAYREGNFCTHEGSLWHCNAATMSRPGTGGDWQLCAKRGKDGADAEASRRSTRSSR